MIWRSALIRLSTRPINCLRISERRVHCLLAQQPSPHDVDASIRAERHESKKALGVVPRGFLASQSNFRKADQRCVCCPGRLASATVRGRQYMSRSTMLNIEARTASNSGSEKYPHTALSLSPLRQTYP